MAIKTASKLEYPQGVSFADSGEENVLVTKGYVDSALEHVDVKDVVSRYTGNFDEVNVDHIYINHNLGTQFLTVQAYEDNGKRVNGEWVSEWVPIMITYSFPTVDEDNDNAAIDPMNWIRLGFSSVPEEKNYRVVIVAVLPDELDDQNQQNGD